MTVLCRTVEIIPICIPIQLAHFMYAFCMCYLVTYNKTAHCFYRTTNNGCAITIWITGYFILWKVLQAPVHVYDLAMIQDVLEKLAQWIWSDEGENKKNQYWLLYFLLVSSLSNDKSNLFLQFGICIMKELKIRSDWKIRNVIRNIY